MPLSRASATRIVSGLRGFVIHRQLGLCRRQASQGLKSLSFGSTTLVTSFSRLRGDGLPGGPVSDNRLFYVFFRARVDRKNSGKGKKSIL